MRKVNKELIPLLNIAAEQQQVTLNVDNHYKALFKVIHETLVFSGTKGIEELEREFKILVEAAKQWSILELEDDGRNICLIHEDEKYCLDYHWAQEEGGHSYNKGLICCRCQFISEEEFYEERELNRIKMFNEGKWRF